MANADNKQQTGKMEQAGFRIVSKEELAKHCKQDDCWVAIQGKVYDVTEFLQRHPGGLMVLLDVAGYDATDVFTAMHPKYVSSMLPQFLIGVLESEETLPMVEDFRKLREKVHSQSLSKPDGMWYLYSSSILIPVFLLVVSLVTSTQSVLLHMLAAFLLGMWINQVNFIGHDAGHNSVTGITKLDAVIGVIVGNMLTGVSMSWWKRTHNVHHIVCNSADYDPDIQHMPLFAISPKLFSSLYSFYHFRKMTFDPIARALISNQHWTFYPIMAVARVNLYIQSLLQLLSPSIEVKNRFFELGAVLVFFTWYSTLVSYLPSLQEKALFVLISHATTGLLHVQICISHFPMPVFKGKPDPAVWFKTQALGTLNVECSPWLDWFHGGLQFQLEHHLFPMVPRYNLRHLVGDVKSFCLKHDIPYLAVSFWEANRMVVKTLREAAMVARKTDQSFTNSILWQALNAQG